MIKIYHNKRCGKSRAGLKLLEDSGKEYQVINYLDTVPTFEELKKIIDMLGIRPIELFRKNELVWKEKFKNKDFSDKEFINIMVKNPKLIERPIVINGNVGVVGRPTEKILEIL